MTVTNREMEDKSPFIAVVLTENQAVAALVAVRAVLTSGSMLAKSDEERETLKPLAGAMVRLAEAIDKARGGS